MVVKGIAMAGSKTHSLPDLGASRTLVDDLFGPSLALRYLLMRSQALFTAGVPEEPRLGACARLLAPEEQYVGATEATAPAFSGSGYEQPRLVVRRGGA